MNKTVITNKEELNTIVKRMFYKMFESKEVLLEKDAEEVCNKIFNGIKEDNEIEFSFGYTDIFKDLKDVILEFINEYSLEKEKAFDSFIEHQVLGKYFQIKNEDGSLTTVSIDGYLSPVCEDIEAYRLYMTGITVKAGLEDDNYYDTENKYSITVHKFVENSERIRGIFSYNKDFEVYELNSNVKRITRKQFENLLLDETKKELGLLYKNILQAESL